MENILEKAPSKIGGAFLLRLAVYEMLQGIIFI